MSNALEAFFNSLKSESDLDQLVRDNREEDLYLEFKQKHDRRNGDLDEDDRYNFSKAISGFANADGGVLIFGIETSKSKDMPDRACALKPITNAERFRNKLTDSILNTTQPPVDGMRMELITGKPGEGYVKCLVPASDLPPHRAMLADREYWRRCTNGCRKMEHYELSEAFGRRRRPALQLISELKPRRDAEEEIHFWFVNKGRGLARHAGFHAEFDATARVVAVDGNPFLKNVSKLGHGSPSVCYSNPNEVIHSNGLKYYLGYVIIIQPKNTDLAFDVWLYAEHMDSQRQRQHFAQSARTILPS